MRIGIDGMATGNRSGTGVYTEQLIAALCRCLDGNHLEVWIPDRAPNTVSLKEWGQAKIHQGNGSGPLTRVWHQQVSFVRQVQRSEIDLFHAPASVASQVRDIPLVVTLHDVACLVHPELFPPVRRWYYRWMIPRSVARATALITDSQWSRIRLAEILDIQIDSIYLAPPGVESCFVPQSQQDQTQVKSRYDLPHRFILFVGVVEPRKRLEILCQAREILARRGTDIPLLVVGRPGWNYEKITEYIDHSQGKIQWLGYVPREDLPVLYSIATIFCYPSIYEGFGLPVVEAMACGCPVVTTSDSAMSEVVDDAAEQIESENPELLAETLERLLNDEERRSELSEKGLARSKQYSWDHTAQKCMEIYDSVVNKPSR